MRIAYVNCASGVAGDMLIAALLSTGFSVKKFEQVIKNKLALQGWSVALQYERALFHVPVRRFVVHTDRHFKSPFEMKKLIARSSFTPRIKEMSQKILANLIRAESRVHRAKKGAVHFHELGSYDTIIDVVGFSYLLHELNIEKIFSSALNIGRPAPAALEILKENKMPVYSDNATHELATPTGIAILATVCEGFGDMPLITITKTGMGAGALRIENNLLTITVGDGCTANTKGYNRDSVVILETNIDDMDPRIYAYVMEQLFLAGVKDVWLTQVMMKKGRPGVVLSVICDKGNEQQALDIIFKETTTLGVRRNTSERYILERVIRADKKIAFFANKQVKVKSEFEVLLKKARISKKPLKDLLA